VKNRISGQAKKPYYPLSKVKSLVKNDNVQINPNARDLADQDFGWDTNDILDAISKLRLKDFYKTESSRMVSGVMVDTYKAYGLKGENVYTHYYVNSQNTLVINSFKEI